MKSQIIKINIEKNQNNSKNIIESLPIVKENNSSNILEDQNNDDIFLKQFLKKKEKKNKEKKILYTKELIINEQQGENSSGKKTVSTSYNINYGPETFRYKKKNPSSYYKKWVNLNYSDSDNNINKSYDEIKRINGKKLKNNNENADAKCCSIF